jgi:hypothetical protein
VTGFRRQNIELSTPVMKLGNRSNESKHSCLNLHEVNTVYRMYYARLHQIWIESAKFQIQTWEKHTVNVRHMRVEISCSNILLTIRESYHKISLNQM